MEPLPDGIVVPQAAAVTTVLRLNSNAQVAASGTVRKLTVAACKKAYSNLVLGPRAVPDVGEVRPFVRIGLYDHTPLPLEGCVFLALCFSRRGTLLQVLVVAVTGHSYEPTEHASSATFSSRRKTVADAFLRVSGLLKTAHYNVATAWEGCLHVTVGKPRVRVRCRCECVADASALQVRVRCRCERVASASALQVRVRCRCKCVACASLLQVRVRCRCECVAGASALQVPRRAWAHSCQRRRKVAPKGTKHRPSLAPPLPAASRVHPATLLHTRRHTSTVCAVTWPAQQAPPSHLGATGGRPTSCCGATPARALA